MPSFTFSRQQRRLRRRFIDADIISAATLITLLRLRPLMRQVSLRFDFATPRHESPRYHAAGLPPLTCHIIDY